MIHHAKSQKVDDIYARGVASFIDPNGVFQKKMETSPEKVNIKLGVDPTRPDIHLGHAAILRKLRAFQERGAKVIFLIGDYTAQIGDPTGKSKVRAEVTQQEVEKNMKTYVDQVGKILLTDSAHFSWIRNSDWFLSATDLLFGENAKPHLDVVDPQGKKISFPLDPNSLLGKTALYDASRMQRTFLKKQEVVGVTLRGLLWTLRHITHARLIERDMFSERLKNHSELYVHEMLYPVLQGVDSQVLAQIYGSCDLEVGGTDQTFNMLMGRDVMKLNNLPPQSVMSIDLLVGTDGVEKMSKSLDNYISIVDEPFVMYGKIMSIPDAALRQYFILATYMPEEDINDVIKNVTAGKEHPRDLKMKLARQIVAIYHGEAAAKSAEDNFVETFQKGKAPRDIPEGRVPSGTPLVGLVLDKGLVASKSEFRRLLAEGAVSVVERNEKINDPFYKIYTSETIRIGAARFLHVIVEA